MIIYLCQNGVKKVYYLFFIWYDYFSDINMKYIDKYLEYLRVVKKYSDMTIKSYSDDLIEYNEFLGDNFLNILEVNYDTV